MKKDKKTQIIQRKIQVFVNEVDKEKRADFIKLLYNWRYELRNTSNELLSYLYAKDKLKYYKFITEGTKQDFGIIGAKGEPVKECSSGYVLMSEKLKGKVPMGIATCMQQSIGKSYAKSFNDLMTGNRSLSTFKNNIPLAFRAELLTKMQPYEGTSLKGYKYCSYHFQFYGIPMAIAFGRDRSNNRAIIEKCLSGEYAFAGSSFMIDDKTNKMYMLISVKMPVNSFKNNEDNILVCALSTTTPIVAMYNDNVYDIGCKEDYLYKRRQIQEGIKRLQTVCRHNVGGSGRVRKMQALERYKEKEFNYASTKLHQYSSELINKAIELNCGTIKLLNPKERTKEQIKENQANGDDYIFRNWAWNGLLLKIQYKANIAGIKIEI
ncbi:MAG: hypothetical protein RR513_09370 [Muribaculaceae bacterium]